MIVKILYKYEREPGKYDVSPVKPEDKEYTIMYRLIAEEGYMLTQDGEHLFACIDVESIEGWYVVEYEEEINE